MLTFKVKHRYCGMEKTIKGNNIFDAFRKNEMDYKYWTVQEVWQDK